MPRRSKNNLLKKNPHSPRFEAAAAKVNPDVQVEPAAALQQVKDSATAKFVETIDMAVKLGIDPRKSDQNVRGLASLPHGTGKVRKVAVLARGDLAKAAEEAGADTVGAEELITQIQGGWRDFDVLLATEDMAPQIGKIGRALGPKTPNKRNGSVTNNIAAAVRDIKAATRVEYRADKAGNVHMPLGKVNFDDDKLLENMTAAMNAIVKAKPASSKGRYIQGVTLSSTMGPAVSVDINLAQKLGA